jgi:hypothetical protein
VVLSACWPSALERIDANAGAPCDGGACGAGDMAGQQGCGAGCGNGESCLSGSCCPAVSYAASIQTIFDAKCAECHGGDSAPMNLRQATSYSALLQAPSGPKCGPGGAGANFGSAWRRVAPGDLVDSVLWWYVQDCCMPACGSACGPRCLPQCSQTEVRCGSNDPLCGGARPTEADRAAIMCWILEGAPNN